MTLPLHGKQRSWQVVITQKNMAKLPGTDETIQHKRANEENLTLDCFFLNNLPLSRCWRATGSTFGGTYQKSLPQRGICTFLLHLTPCLDH